MDLSILLHFGVAAVWSLLGFTVAKVLSNPKVAAVVAASPALTSVEQEVQGLLNDADTEHKLELLLQSLIARKQAVAPAAGSVPRA